MIELFLMLFIITTISYILHYFIELTLLTIKDNSAKKHLVTGIIIALLTIPTIILIQQYREYTIEITLIILTSFILNFIQGLLDIENYKHKKINLLITIIANTTLLITIYYLF